MKENHHLNASDPTSILQAAIEQIEIFTKTEATRLEVKENGKLVAIEAKGLDSIIGLAKRLISPLLSEQVRQKQAQRLIQIKQQLLKARDTIQYHSVFIEELQGGDSAQQRFANWALAAIKRYNAFIGREVKEPIWTNFERNTLLLDKEIKGKEIHLSHSISIKYNSSNPHLAQKTLKELSEALVSVGVGKSYSAIHPTHKKTDQVMVDAFRLKASRMMQNHFSDLLSLSEITQMINCTPIETKQDSASTAYLQQIIEILPGFRVILSGSFRKHSIDSKWMSFPLLDPQGLRLNVHSIQTGFPYPSQHLAWSLADELVAAEPLRDERVALFHHLAQKKEKIVANLLADPKALLKIKQDYRVVKETFDQRRSLFLPYHRQLQEAILKASNSLTQDKGKLILDHFYQSLENESSPFDLLSHTQQKLLTLFVADPIKKLKEVWLSEQSLLNVDSSKETFQAAVELFTKEREKALNSLNMREPAEAFIALLGPILGQASQSIILQYLSEKMGFSSLILTDFEQKVQACAFQEHSTFLSEMDGEALEKEEMERVLQEKFLANIAVFQLSALNACGIVEELENYFSRISTK